MARLQESPFAEQGRQLGWYGIYHHTPPSFPCPTDKKHVPTRQRRPGFYVLDASSDPHHPSLILGPFQGKVACQTIAFGRGVCGAAASTQRTQLVPDVDRFPGHIACDGASKSEIVVPVTVDVLDPAGGPTHLLEKKTVAIIDVDCAEPDGFDEVDQRFMEELARLLGRACDW